MGNTKITKVGIFVALALAGGVNYFSFSDMGNNIDNHVIEPIKISMEKSRIAEEKAEKEKEEKEKIDAEIKAKRLEKQLAKQKEETQRIARLLQEKAEQNKKIIEDMNKVKNTPVAPIINYSIPSSNNGNNATYMTAFGISTAAETVKKMDAINPENYIIYKNLNGGAVFATLKIDVDSRKEYTGLTPDVNNNYTQIMVSQSGQQYLLEDRCRTLGNDLNWLKIIPDSPSVLSKSNQICSLLPVVDKDNKVEVNSVSISDNVIKQSDSKDDLNNVGGLTNDDIKRSLDFNRYKNIVSQSRNYYSSGGKSGNITFQVNNNGFVDSAIGNDKGISLTKLNEYYNSIMISSDRREILVYNKLCPINFESKNVIVKMSDSENNEQYFIGNDKGLITSECAVLPLIKSQD